MSGTLLILCFAWLVGTLPPAQVQHNLTKAERLFDVLRAMDLGKAEKDTMADLAPYKPFLWHQGKDANTGALIFDYRFDASNTKEFNNHPYTSLHLLVTYSGDRLVAKRAVVFIASGLGGFIQQEETSFAYDNHPPPSRARRLGGSQNATKAFTDLSVEEDTRVDHQQLEADWFIDFSCLEKSAVCSDAKQIFPHLHPDFPEHQ